MTSTEEYRIARGSNDWSSGWRDGFAVVAGIFADDSSEPKEGMAQSQIWLSTADGTWDEVDMNAFPVSNLAPRDYHGSSLGLLVLGEVWPEEGAESATGDTFLV